MSADVIQLRPRADAPVQQFTPRTEFGQRRRGEFSALVASCSDEVRDALSCRPEDREAQERVKRAAREARNALDGAHIDPSLKAELAAKVGVVAEMCERLSEQAKFLGELRAAVQLREHQGLLETLSAELVP